jgi:integrase
MPRKRQSRTYLKRGRYYGDFRDFADVGGGKEALTPSGHRHATQDPAVAAELVQARIAELERLRKNGVWFTKPGVADAPARDLTRLEDFADYHLEMKARNGMVTNRWLATAEHHLDTAVAFFGPRTKLITITPKWMTAYAAYLTTLGKWTKRDGSQPKDEPIGPASQRKYLNSLSNLFRRAIADGIVPLGYNPVAHMFERPTGERVEAEWLEVHEAALLLYAAKLYRPRRKDLALLCVYALVATLLLTGGRLAEVLGLHVGDVDFERKIVVFRKRADRRLKTPGSERTVPLWPQLEEILREYLAGPDAPTGIYLFPTAGAPNTRVTDIRRVLAELSIRIGRGDATLHSKVTRHTYCAARLQTLDHGSPIPQYTVERELGHRSSKMVTQIYGHLGRIRHRSEHVEYRVEQFIGDLGDRVADVERRSAERNRFERRDLRVDPAVEALVLAVTAEVPEKGPIPVAEEVCNRGMRVSGSGVGWIWRRHGLSRTEHRLAAIESGRLQALEQALRSQSKN